MDRPEAQINADSRFTPNLGWRSIAAASYGTIEAYAADFDRSVRIDILQVGLMSLAAPGLPDRPVHFDRSPLNPLFCCFRAGHQRDTHHLTRRHQVSCVAQLLLKRFDQRLNCAVFGEPVAILRDVVLVGHGVTRIEVGKANAAQPIKDHECSHDLGEGSMRALEKLCCVWTTRAMIISAGIRAARPHLIS